MVIYAVLVGPLAQESLRNIYAYLQTEAGLVQADKVIDGIIEKIESLERFPEAHEKEHVLNDGDIVYHRTFAHNYRIIFTINEAQVNVEVIEVIHTSRSAKTMIRKIKP